MKTADVRERSDVVTPEVFTFGSWLRECAKQKTVPNLITSSEMIFDISLEVRRRYGAVASRRDFAAAK
jgi:hypothetical protein